jgi:hypothetical protein
VGFDGTTPILISEPSHKTGGKMRFSTILLLLVIAHATSLLSAQTSAVPELHYRSVPDFLHLPADLYFGEVTGVAVNSHGHIFVFSRGNTTGPAYGLQRRSYWNSTGMENFYAKLATTSMHGPMHIPSRSIRRTTSGSPTRVRMSSSSSLRKGESPWFSVASRRRRMTGRGR